MCLEEMYSINVAYGAFFYGEIRHRVEVEITPRLRNIVRECAKEMHNIFQSRHIPLVSKGKQCPGNIAAMAAVTPLVGVWIET